MAGALSRAVPPLLLVLTAAWWVFGYMAEVAGAGVASFDIYNSYYPNAVYALRSLQAGHGILWNPLQNCGQPFLPATIFGPFYPLNLVYLAFDVATGITVIAFLHLVVGGLGTYLLCREIGLGRAAAVCGALGFQLGSHLLRLAGWVPVSTMGSYVWLPLALFLCERTLRTPTLRLGLYLGVVLTTATLAGNPQLTMFTYQLLLLRVVFELVVPGGHPVRPALGPLAIAFVLPFALAAAELLPATEFVVHSIRGRRLNTREMQVATLDWTGFRRALAGQDWDFGRSLSISFAALAPLAFVARKTRRQGIFYALVVVLFTTLAYDGPVLRFYLSLPLGSIFRLPTRFLWLASFGACMLTALGADAITRRTAAWRWQLPVLVLLGATTLWVLAGTPPQMRDRWTLAGLAIAAVVAMVPGISRPVRAIPVIAPAVVGGFLLSASREVFFTYTDWGTLLGQDAPVFAFLRERMTAQDRFYAISPQTRPGLAEKTATMFGLPSITDYEPQTSQRLGELDVLMRANRAMQSAEDLVHTRQTPQNRRILDLLATRYLIVGKKGEQLPPALVAAWLKIVGQVGDVVVYENPNAFPRALYVPTAKVSPDPGQRARAIAFGRDDLRQTVLLEAAPPDAFLGTPGARGEAQIEEDRSEHVRIRVRADAPGFLLLTDQDYPGWTAAVNGAEVPTLHANHAFRAVAVPAGDSTVVWRYRPASVPAGLAISLVTIVVVGIVGVTRRR